MVSDQTASDALRRRAAVHAALGEPARLAIVDELAASDRSPSELGQRLGMASNLVAHHLEVLEAVGLIVRFAVGRRRATPLRPPGAGAVVDARHRRQRPRGDAVVPLQPQLGPIPAGGRAVDGPDRRPASSAGTSRRPRSTAARWPPPDRAGLSLAGATPSRVGAVPADGAGRHRVRPGPRGARRRDRTGGTGRSPTRWRRARPRRSTTVVAEIDERIAPGAPTTNKETDDDDGTDRDQRVRTDGPPRGASAAPSARARSSCTSTRRRAGSTPPPTCWSSTRCTAASRARSASTATGW